jgi:hypothetical protein
MCSRVPFRCCIPGRPKVETSIGNGGDDGREAEADGREVTMVDETKCSVALGRVVGREEATAGCASNEVKSLTLFQRASSAALISALTSASIGRCWKVPPEVSTSHKQDKEQVR